MVQIKDLITELHVHEVRFVIIGGQAAVLQGSAYLTADIDLCYARDQANLGAVVRALERFHPILRGADRDLPFLFDAETLRKGLNFTFSTDVGDIDLLGEIAGLGFYEQVVKYSEELEIYDIPCRVLTLEGLIKSKKATGRQKDVLLLKELEMIRKLRKSQRKKK